MKNNQSLNSVSKALAEFVCLLFAGLLLTLNGMFGSDYRVTSMFCAIGGYVFIYLFGYIRYKLYATNDHVFSKTKDIDAHPDVSSESLGAHLRNLLSPYKNLLSLVHMLNKNEITLEAFRRYTKHEDECLNNLIDFSRCDKMENTNWRD